MLCFKGGFPRDDESEALYSSLLSLMPSASANMPPLVDQLISFLEMTALSGASERDDAAVLDACQLCTIHQAKGLEWRVVFVVQCLEGTIPSHQALKKGEDGSDGVEEERRLMFVALSRAKQLLYVTYPRPVRDGRRSQFIEEILATNIQPIKTLSAGTSSGFRTARSLSSSAMRSELVQEVAFECEEADDVRPDENLDAGETVPKKARQIAPKDAFQFMMTARKK